MENDLYFIQGSTLRGIGNAIRTKKGGTEEIPPLDMEAQILSISGGVNFDGLTEVYPVTELTASADLGGMATLTTPFGMVAGNVYLVCWNDTLYSCEAKEAEFGGTPVVAIGNVSALGGEDTGEPFVIGEFSEEVAAEVGINVGIMPMDGSTTFEVGVYFIAEKGSGSSDDVRYVTFMNGSEFLYKKAVATGDDCVDVYVKGLIGKPTKESTAQHDFTFAEGWSLTDGGEVYANALKNVTEDRIVYAAYTSTIKQFTVNFYDGETLVDTVQVPYGGTATTTYSKADYKLIGWEPSNENITQDTDCYGTFEYNPWIEEEIADSWEAIVASVNDGTYKEKYTKGNYKTFTAYGGGIVRMQIVAFDSDELSDGSGKAAITWISKDLITNSTYQNFQLNTSSTTIGGWPASSSFTVYLNIDLIANYGTGIASLKSAIKKVKKVCLSYTEDGEVEQITVNAKCFMPSHREIFGDNTYETEGVTYFDPAFATAARRKRGYYSSGTFKNATNQGWLRTPCSATEYCTLTSGGAESKKTAATSSSITHFFGFCI